MILTLSLDHEEFAAQRRRAQDDYVEALRPAVRASMDSGDWAPLIVVVTNLYRQAYFEETGDREGFPAPVGWVQQIESTLEQTKGDGKPSEDRIATWLAASVINVAAMEASLNDPEPLVLEWVTMHDEDVRAPHAHTDGQQRPRGEAFDVDGTPMDFPGDSRAPIELWINCRCTLRPVLAEESLVAGAEFVSEKAWDGSAGRFTLEQYHRSCILHRHSGKPTSKSECSLPIREPDGALSRAGVHAAASRIGQVDATPEQKAAAKRALRGAYRMLKEEVPESLTAAADEEPVQDARTSTVVVALPAAQDAVNGLGDEPSHVTLLYVGEPEEGVTDVLRKIAEALSNTYTPFQADVAGTGVLGPDQAKVLIVEAHEFNALHGALEQDPTVQAALRGVDTHPHFVPHLTVTYEGDMPGEVPESITIDRLAVWHGDEQTEYPLGEGVETDEDEAMVAAGAEDIRVPWHGVLAPEGIRSGDGRKFKEGALRHRDLPLPLTWQKISDDGHKGNVTVATIEAIEKVDGEMRASGWFLDTPEAGEVMGLIAEFGKFGVSVDADDATFEVDEEAEEVVFTDARVSSACIVPIPAFMEAWVALGTWDGSDSEPQGVYDESLAAAALASTDHEFVDVAPGRTEDGPGWLTHPVDTDRLRDYWTKGPGAAKIGWGSPGDFNRCRAQVAKYVKPQHLNGYCANRHYDALGFWPGRPVNGHVIKFDSAADALGLTFTEPSEAISMTASAGLRAPAEWFKDPGLDAPTPITVTDEGRVFGHIATWGTCHIGFDGQCITPPHSLTDYAYFLTGEVSLDNGSSQRVGNLTIGGGHADPRLRMRPALAHYDSTSAVVCDVNVGEDAHGIWFAGWVRPGTSEEMVTAFRASALSGDWRKVGGNLELIAALAVNVPGFGIPRPKVAASAEGQLSLVASGVVPPNQDEQPSKIEAERIADSLAASVAAILEERAARRAQMQALAARITKE